MWGRRPFTLIAWTKFVGKRHLVAGIWDEGGWDKYGGRRQIALFGGLFGSKSVIGHISATGASSYPQSTISGSQYARCRAIDGQGFANDQWVALAMTFEPDRDEVVVYTNGTATPTNTTDSCCQGCVSSREADCQQSVSFSPGRSTHRGRLYSSTTGTTWRHLACTMHWLEVDAGSGQAHLSKELSGGC